jgi:endonuclease III
MDSLVSLRGVGRKTASIVLGNAFGVPAVAVDRHVERVATRLGFTRKGADGIEQELRSLYPKKDWVKATWNFVLHGRRICTPTPKCPSLSDQRALPLSEEDQSLEHHAPIAAAASSSASEAMTATVSERASPE